MTTTVEAPAPRKTRWKDVTTTRLKRRATLAQVRRIAADFGFDPDEIIDAGGRYFIPNALITQEINDALRASRAERARRIGRSVVAKHAETMEATGWVFNMNSPVLIDTNGEAVGGGHRLEAAAQVGVAIRMPVEFDVDDSVLSTTDINKRATLAELLAYAAEEYADDPRFVDITLSCVAGFGRRQNVAPDAAEALVGENFDAMLWLTTTLDGALDELGLKRVPKVTINSVLAAFAMAWHYTAATTVKRTLAPGLRALVKGEARGGKSGNFAAMLYLRDVLADGGLTAGEAFAITAGAIEMMLDGRKPRGVDALVYPDTNPYPWVEADEDEDDE
ncbi:MAG: hypothetical protein KDD66_00025 [Bdellovibrionales bacterium]|nr:hypothetical protein [Bdellovibrionales bacterium]